MTPFEYQKAEKKQGLEKQKLATLKNQMLKSADKGKTLQVLDNKKSLKLREEQERN